jgi:hypothetical protein
MGGDLQKLHRKQTTGVISAEKIVFICDRIKLCLRIPQQPSAAIIDLDSRDDRGWPYW